MYVLHHKSDGYEAAYTDRNRSEEWKIFKVLDMLQ